MACTVGPPGGLLLLLLAMLLPGHAQTLPEGEVTVDLPVYRALIAEDEPAPDPRARVVVRDRDVRLRWDGEVLRVRAVWKVDARERTWFTGGLAGPSVRVDRVTVDGRPADLSVQNRWTWITERIEGETTLVLEGAVEGDPTRGPLAVPLADAAFGRVHITVPDGLEGRLLQPGDAVRTPDRWLTAAEGLMLAIGPPQRKARDRRTLAVASVGMGITAGEGALLGRAHLRYALRQGQLDEVRFRVDGIGSDLEVTGSNVGRVDRRGDTVIVALREPETARLDLDLRWSTAVPATDTARLPLPRVLPEGTFRTDASVQLARDASLEVLPELGGWQPVAAQDLPDWGDDLVTGTPTAAYRAGSAGKGGTLGLLRFVPAKAPPIVVDVASLTVATSSEGRALYRALYTVRNELGSHLAITPPEGAIILGVRVDDGPATPVRDGERWLVPLPRSLETLDGLLSFPVEVVLLGDGTPWVRKEARELPLPVVDAPVAVNRVTLHLPPTFDNQLDLGEGGTVEDFTEGEGIAYGFGLGGADEAKADQLWQDAQAAYMRNDFDEADAILDDLEGLGATNENLGKLRGNLDVVQGRAGDKSKSLNARRVREQAKSRGLDTYRRQDELLRKAEEELAAGSYGEAQQTYEEVARLAEKLDKLEQDESFEQKKRLEIGSSGSSAASSGLAWQQSIQTSSPDRDRQRDAANASALVQLQREAEGEGLVSRSADTGEVSGVDRTVLGQALDGRVSVEGELSFVPDEDASSVAVQVMEEAEAERRRASSSGEGLVVVEGSVAGFGKGAAGVTDTITLKAPEPEPRVEALDQVEERSSLSLGVKEAKPAPPSSRGRRRSRSRDGGAEDQDLAELDSERTRRSVKVLDRRSPREQRRAGRDRGGKKAKKPAAAPEAPMDLEEESEEDLFDEVVISGDFEDADDAFLDAPAAGPEAANTKDAVPDAYALEALQVTSTRMSVVVPVQGETLRYQHLLLPAGAEHVVRIEARSSDSYIPRRLP